MSLPAPARTRVLASGRFEATTLLRNGEQLLVSIVLPLMVGAIITLAGLLLENADQARRP